MEGDSRVVALIDMDCFFCQVEEKLDPNLKGKPVAVVQYRGGIIAVNYIARAQGLTKRMSANEAKKLCPDIQLPSVPGERGKADTMRYRDAGKEIALVLQKFTPLLERASVDEAYLDITESVKQRLKTTDMNLLDKELFANTYALGYNTIDEFISDVKYGNSGDHLEFDDLHARKLLIGALIVSEIRKAVYDETGYECSAGIAHNKILAKLVCGMNKPNKQTILPKHSLNVLYSSLPLKKVKNLGGKFGDAVCDVLKITTMGELQQFPERRLQQVFDEKNGSWLYNISRGVDTDPVLPRFNSKSIGCCKQFPNKSAFLTELNMLIAWLNDLGDEIGVRLEKDALENNRTPKQMVASFTLQLPGNKDVSSSKSYNFAPQDVITAKFLASKTFELIRDRCEIPDKDPVTGNAKLKFPIKFLSISVGKFEENVIKNVRKIQDFFAAGSAKPLRVNSSKDNIEMETKSCQALQQNKDLKKSKRIADFFSVKPGENMNASPTLHHTHNEVQKTSSPENKVEYTEVKIKQEADDSENNITRTNSMITSPLNKQESFFQKFFNVIQEEKKHVELLENRPCDNTTQSSLTSSNRDENDSNDSNYSASTIEMEINKSKSLLDTSPDSSKRIEGMRKLLSSAVTIDTKDRTNNSDEETSDLDDAGIDCEESDQKEVKKALHKKSPEHSLNHRFISDLIKCFECGKEVRESVFMTHTDYHLAVKLRREERAATEIANKVILKTRQANHSYAKIEVSQKKLDHVKSDNSNMSIKKFFTKENNIDENVVTQICPECNKKVPLETYIEHLDFHEAKKLHREINKIELPKTTPAVNNGKSDAFAGTTCSKRKRLTSSPRKKERKICKSIDTFFKS